MNDTFISGSKDIANDRNDDDYKVIIRRNIFFRSASLAGADGEHISSGRVAKYSRYCCQRFHRNCSCHFLKAKLLAFFPFIRIMKNYKITTDLPGDIVAGLTVGVMHIPQGLWLGTLTFLILSYYKYINELLYKNNSNNNKNDGDNDDNNNNGNRK